MKSYFLILACGITLTAQAQLAPLQAPVTQKCDGSIPEDTPDNRYIINEDNTVTDKKTGLTWMRCSLGQKGKGCGGVAAIYDYNLINDVIAKNYSDWRLPSILELNSLVERTCLEPAINIEIFPNTPKDKRGLFISSTPFTLLGDDSGVWALNYFEGKFINVEWKVKGKFHIRLVRDAK